MGTPRLTIRRVPVCPACGRSFEANPRGRPRKYCPGDRCKQRAYDTRKAGRQLPPVPSANPLLAMLAAGATFRASLLDEDEDEDDLDV